jgi:hypothetical protein
MSSINCATLISSSSLGRILLMTESGTSTVGVLSDSVEKTENAERGGEEGDGAGRFSGAATMGRIEGMRVGVEKRER